MNRRNLIESLLATPFIPKTQSKPVNTKEKDFQKIHNLLKIKWSVHEYADEHVDNPDNPSKIDRWMEPCVLLQEYTTFNEFMKTLESMEKESLISGQILLYRNGDRYYYGIYAVYSNENSYNCFLGNKPYTLYDLSNFS